MPADGIVRAVTTPIKLSAKPGVPMKLRTAASYRLVIGGAAQVEFRNILGEPLESAYVLERADGRLEEGRLEEGGLLRADAAANEKFKVHFPALDALEWGVEWVEVPDGESKAEVELVLKHKALGPANEAVFSFFEELDDEELADDAAAEAPLHEIKAKLATDPKKLLETQETRVRWALDGLEPPGPEGVRRVVCRAAVGGLEIESPVLDVYGPSPEEPEKPPEVLRVEFRDAAGKPLESAYILEHPDGELEPGRLEKGILRREVDAKGTFKVHFPKLIDASFAAEAVEFADGAAAPELEVILKHAAFASAAATATFSFFREFEGDDDADDAADEPDTAPLGEVRAALSADGADLLAPRETRVRWKLAGLAPPDPGTACRVVCRVQAGGLEIEGASIDVFGAAPDDPD